MNKKIRKSGRKDSESKTDPLAARICAELSGVSSRKKLVVAVSGGADSVALLYLLLEAGQKNLIVAHFNHRLRGAASGQDALFVERLATKLQLPFECDTGDVKGAAKRQKISLETAAREARYSFLSKVAGRHRTRSIVLAHHADDQVETCLFQFLRGSGAAGLSGMKPLSRRTIDGLTLDLHRPLLKIQKNDLLSYLEQHKIRFREDASNAVAEASRNKLRLKVLPLIEDLLGPSFRRSVVRNAQIFAEEEDFLSSLALPLAVDEALSVKTLRQLHPALQRRVIHAWLKARGVFETGFAEVERTLSLLEMGGAGGPAKINLPGNRYARRRTGTLFIEP